jgi:hypothetical protein
LSAQSGLSYEDASKGLWPHRLTDRIRTLTGCEPVESITNR